MQLLIDPASWRPAPGVAAQPRVVLAHWRLFVGQGRGRYLAGVLPGQATLRVTSAIVAADPLTRTWRTVSGRVHETPGPPAREPALCALLASMVATDKGNNPPVDVSDAAWFEMRQALQ